MSIKNNTKFVYSLSSKPGMVFDTIQSIKTLKEYVDPKKIVVFYTPPYDSSDEEELRKLAVDLRKEENQTEKFSMNAFGESKNYGEKTKLAKIESENVVFLDCDTLVLGDIWRIIEGDFDFKAIATDVSQEEGWNELFEKYNEEYISWMPNAGFLIFKNNIHKQIGEKWIEYTNTELDFIYNNIDHREQTALALAVSGHKTEKMTNKEHVREWVDKPTSEGIVYHLETPERQTLYQHILNSISRKSPFNIRDFRGYLKR